jgi:hypothetical protein
MTAVSVFEEPGNTYRASWTLTTAAGTGVFLKQPGASDRSVQAFGTFGGATCILEGSNDPRVETDPGNAVWSPLTDASTTAISFTAAGIEAVNENPLYIRPRLSVAGTGATITVSLVSKGVR